jgi:hypothetical protein
MADVPQIDYTEKIRAEAVKIAVAQLPPKVRAVWNDKDLRHFVASFYCYDGIGASVPGYDRDDNKIHDLISAGVASLKMLDEQQDLALKALREKLKACAYSVTTRKALADMLPEFAKYLPADEASANRSLPVVANVVADFVRAGWPKGSKKAIKTTA